MELLFDLDGTLTDPAVGITLCLQHALQQLGHTPPPVDELKRFIGPPLHANFSELLSTTDRELLDRAIAHYRERFADTGLFENKVYDGVVDGLAALRKDGHRLWVVTSKPEVFARRIISHFNLDPYFKRVYGSELSGVNTDKADLIAHVLQSESLDPSDAWMIGDRALDVIAGRANATRTVGVLWGYGSEAELMGARPDALVNSMPILHQILSQSFSF